MARRQRTRDGRPIPDRKKVLAEHNTRLMRELAAAKAELAELRHEKALREKRAHVLSRSARDALPGPEGYYLADAMTTPDRAVFDAIQGLAYALGTPPRLLPSKLSLFLRERIDRTWPIFTRSSLSRLIADFHQRGILDLTDVRVGMLVAMCDVLDSIYRRKPPEIEKVLRGEDESENQSPDRKGGVAPDTPTATPELQEGSP